MTRVSKRDFTPGELVGIAKHLRETAESIQDLATQMAAVETAEFEFRNAWSIETAMPQARKFSTEANQAFQMHLIDLARKGLELPKPGRKKGAK